VISHDRYFLERVCDTFVGLLGDAELRDLPGGIDQYLQLRAKSTKTPAVNKQPIAKASILEIKALKKEVARLERAMQKADERASQLEREQSEVAFDHNKLAEVMKELSGVHEEKAKLEEAWLEASHQLEENGN
jgi:ATP-binding cassette subfamily F protein uup